LKKPKFSFELEAVEFGLFYKIMRELAMDGSLAFAVQVVPWHPAITTFLNPFTSDVPSEALAFPLFTAR